MERQLAGLRADRDNADVVSEEIAASIVNFAKGDPTFGENSALSASFGYIRKSGLTRTTSNVVCAPAELKVAT